MDRVVRLVGVLVLLGITLWAYRLYDRSVVETVDASVDIEQLASVGGALSGSGPADETVPAYRNFAALWPPRIYLVDRGDRPSFLDGTARADDEAATSQRSNDRDRQEDDEPTPGSMFYGQRMAHASLIGFGRIPPGLYATSFETTGCRYQIQRADRNGDLRPIGQDHLDHGRALVYIDAIEADVFTAFPQCGGWSSWSPLVEPMERAGSGDYWVGDLASGVWTVPGTCLWEKVVGFRGARLADVVDSGRGPGVLVVDDETLGLRIRGCQQPMELADPK